MYKSNVKSDVFKITASALLVAIGIIIPMFSPVRVIIPPAASYTLASHVAIFIAMFISPKVAIAVTLGTTLGFQLAGFPLPIVLRALTHLVWAWPAAVYLSRIDKFNMSWGKLRVLSLVIAVVHGVAEFAAVVLFYFGTGFPDGQGILWILGFIGLGTVIHSMVDFELANVVREGLQTQKGYRALAANRNRSPE